MEEVTLFEIHDLYRDNFRIRGYSYGEGEKALCIVGSTRGNEYQQVYTCSLLNARFKEMEEEGKITPGRKILIIPCTNPYSMNLRKRFWTNDNTDINRMFPGYDQGETTQRIAAGIFHAVKDYPVGIQFASFYMRGAFMPHVRMMKTGFENVEMAAEFGFPYIVIRRPRPFDTTTLNYNWQIWETSAFSIYTTSTDRIDRESACQAVDKIMNFCALQGILKCRASQPALSRIVDDAHLVTVRSEKAGFFEKLCEPGDTVKKGALLARIFNMYTGQLEQEIVSPKDGTIFFACDDDMAYASTAVFKLIV